MNVALLLLFFGIQEGMEVDSYEYANEAEVQQALAETLAQPEFARLTRDEESSQDAPEWLLRFFRWLRSLFDSQDAVVEGPASALPAFLRIPILMGVLLVVVLFLVKALASVRRRRSASAEEVPAATVAPAVAPGEIHPEEYWLRALEHGRSLRYREGIRELLLGAMSAAERRGSIRYRRGLTNRDYFHAMRGPSRLSFGSIASAFERVFFGRREATSESYEACCREYQKSFRGAAR